MEKSFTHSFKKTKTVNNYENYVYSAESGSTFIWNMQKKRLRKLLEALPANVGGLRHLDFACGTGRILEFVNGFAEHATGIDTSMEMLDVARKRVDNVQFVLGDLVTNDGLCKSKYDVITAFRFFLNAEPELRRKAIYALGQRLDENSGRIIFNIHGNKHSLRHFTVMRRRKKFKGQVNEMSFNEVKQLAEEVGLEIEHWYGYGVMPEFFYRTIFRPIARAIDNIFEKIPVSRFIGYDMMFVCKVKNPK